VNGDDHRIEVFVFPDGRSVEMLVFDASARRRGAATPVPLDARHCAPCCAPAPPPREDEDVHECPVCGSALVYPVDWERSGDAAWTLDLRCPECETRREVVLGRASLDRFNHELYRGSQAIAREADFVTRRNFEDEVERIVVALERDLILPMDF
jgi:hypothetical protein